MKNNYNKLKSLVSKLNKVESKLAKFRAKLIKLEDKAKNTKALLDLENRKFDLQFTASNIYN